MGAGRAASSQPQTEPKVLGTSWLIPAQPSHLRVGCLQNLRTKHTGEGLVTRPTLAPCGSAPARTSRSPCGRCAVSVSQLTVLVTADSVRTPRDFPSGRRSLGPQAGAGPSVPVGKEVGEGAASAGAAAGGLRSRLLEGKPHVGPVIHQPRAGREAPEARRRYCVNVVSCLFPRCCRANKLPLEAEGAAHPGVDATGKQQETRLPGLRGPGVWARAPGMWLRSPLVPPGI